MTTHDCIIRVTTWNGIDTLCSVQEARDYFESIKAICPCTFKINHCWFRKTHVRGRLITFYDVDIIEPWW